jgi:hypothetical protein
MIWFVVLEDVLGATIYQRLSTQYRNSVLPKQSIYKRIEKWKNCCTSVTLGEGAGRLSTAINEDNIEHACDIVCL